MQTENKLLLLSDQLKQRRFDPNKTPAPDQVIFTIKQDNNTFVIGALCNYIVFSGQAKAGKSTYLTAAISSAFLPSFVDKFGMKITTPPGRPVVGYFDTESSQYDFYRQIDRIKQFTGAPNFPQNLHAYTTREDGPQRIRALIMEYLKNTPECSVLFVDGFLDLCLNYNDELETRLLTNWFKKITKQFNILLVGVLHLSKGNGQTLGHLGSNTDRWAQSTLTIERDTQSGQLILKPKFLRSAPDFTPISIMNFNGAWQSIPYIEPAIDTFKNRKY